MSSAHATPIGSDRAHASSKRILTRTALLCMTLSVPCARVQGQSSDVGALEALLEARDYFRLLEGLEAYSGPVSPRVLYLRASLEHASNEPAKSNASIDEALGNEGLEDALRLKLLRLKRGNQLRLHDYASAHRAAERVLELPEALSSPVELEDDENMKAIFAALVDVAPQRLTRSEETTLEMTRDAAGGLRMPVRIGAEGRAYLPDTGANLSVLMRSEVEALGLEPLGADVRVGTSTGEKVSADLSVAPRLVIGELEYENVVFLVFPDELLSFPEAGFRIPGIIGFPVLEAMGRIRFRADDVLQISSTARSQGASNLALHGLVPLVRVGYGESFLLCQLDTGANETAMYEPFFRRHHAEVRALGEPKPVTTAGVGSKIEMMAYQFPEMELMLGGATVRLEAVDVYTESLVDEENNYLDCNVGRDVLDPFDAYTLDFRSMMFLLH